MVRMEVGKRYRTAGGDTFTVERYAPGEYFAGGERSNEGFDWRCSDKITRKIDGTLESHLSEYNAVECLDEPKPPINVTTEGPYGWLLVGTTDVMVGPGLPADRPQNAKVCLAALDDETKSKLKKEARNGYNIAYAEGRKSRDAEVAALKQRIVELLYSLESATERADELEAEADERDEATPFLYPDDLAIRIDSGNAVQIVLYAEDESKTKVAGVVALDSDQIEKLGTLLDWIGCDA